MLQELLTLLPQELGSAALTLAIMGAALGLGLWLLGARYSRALVTLIAVAVGTLAGENLPGWCGWRVNEMGCAVGGAVVLGVAAFAMHRLFVGFGLGLLLAWWAGLATWTLLNDGHALAWPALEAEWTAARHAEQLWEALPGAVARVLPFACGAGFLSGMMTALLWPRVAVVFNWSLAGLSMVIALGLIAIEHGKQEWLEMLPAQTWAQLLAFFGLVMFGAVVQWVVAPAEKPRSVNAEPPPPPDINWDCRQRA